MNTTEKKTALSLGLVFATRMLGLFMILPIFAVLGKQLEGATPALIGLAIGAYGLTQAMLQIPFGRLSDRLGRKPVILIGLMLFALGSAVAASAESIGWVIIGRLLQGSGAIASAVMALAADLSRDEQRSKVMAAIGMSIGVAFTIAMTLGPLLADFAGLSGVFWSSALLAVLSALVILFWTPEPEQRRHQPEAIADSGQIVNMLLHPQLWRLNFGIFALHFLLTAFFVVFPEKLADYGISLSSAGGIYFIVMGLSAVVMVPAIILAERKWWHRSVMVIAMLGVAGMELLLAGFVGPLWGLVLLMSLFFAGFNVLEALFPSLVSRVAPAAAKGTALGVYSTSQFLGASLGGPLAGWLSQTYGIEAVFWSAAAMAAVWAIAATGLRSPSRLTSYSFTVRDMLDESTVQGLLDDIRAVRGVAEAVALPEAGAVYLKIDQKDFDEPAMQRLKLQLNNAE